VFGISGVFGIARQIYSDKMEKSGCEKDAGYQLRQPIIDLQRSKSQPDCILLYFL
jgi:hypothetical protein